MMKINSDKVAWKDIGKEVVAIDLESNMQYIFNETSRATWISLAEGAETLDVIIDEIREHFSGVPVDEILVKEISDFIDDMAEKGLILVENPVGAKK